MVAGFAVNVRASIPVATGGFGTYPIVSPVSGSIMYVGVGSVWPDVALPETTQ